MERATLPVPVVLRINIRSRQREGNEKVITEGWFFSAYFSSKLYCKIYVYCLLILDFDIGPFNIANRKTQTHLIITERVAVTDKGRLLSQHSSPDMQHKEVVGRDNNYRRNPVN